LFNHLLIGLLEEQRLLPIRFSKTLGQSVGVALLGTYFNSVVTTKLSSYKTNATINGENLNKLINPNTGTDIPAFSTGTTSGAYRFRTSPFVCCYDCHFTHLPDFITVSSTGKTSS
jgi:hypothetical protein